MEHASERLRSLRRVSALTDFKEFLLRGSVVDLAVGIVIGAAFGAVVTALVADLITPLIAAISGSHDFSSLTFTINGSRFGYGDFINKKIEAVFSEGLDPTERICHHQMDFK